MKFEVGDRLVAEEAYSVPKGTQVIIEEIKDRDGKIATIVGNNIRTNINIHDVEYGHFRLLNGYRETIQQHNNTISIKETLCRAVEQVHEQTGICLNQITVNWAGLDETIVSLDINGGL